MAVANYHELHGHFPPAYIADKDGRPLLSWRVLVLPFLDQMPLYKQFELNEPWDSRANSGLLKHMPPTYRLHGRLDENSTTTDYVAIVGEETLWQGAEPRDWDFISDDPSETLLIAEFVGRPIPWTKPEDLLFDEIDLAVDSDEGICSILSPPAYVTADGLVRFLPRGTSKKAVRALLTARGNDQVGTLSQPADGRMRPRKRG